MSTTNTYKKGEFSHSEKLCILKEYVKMGRIRPGQKLFLGDIKKDKQRSVSFNTRSIWIGDAQLDWPYDHPLMKKFVLEIHVYE